MELESTTNESSSDSFKLGKCISLLLNSNNLELSPEQVKSLNSINSAIREEQQQIKNVNTRKQDEPIIPYVANVLLSIMDSFINNLQYSISAPFNYFNVVRLYHYLFNHNQSVLINFLKQLVIDIISLTNQQHQQPNNSNNSEELTTKKKQLLNQLIMYIHLISTLKSISIDDESNQLDLFELLESLLSLMDTQTSEQQQQPTRLAVEASDLNITFLIMIVQQLNKNQHPTQTISLVINRMIDIINRHLNTLSRWHQAKPMFSFSIGLILSFNKQLVINDQASVERFIHWYQRVLPLLYYQMTNSVSLKESILKQNIDTLLKISIESDESSQMDMNDDQTHGQHQQQQYTTIDLDIIDRCCISIFIVIGSVNETRQNQMVHSNMNELTDISSFLIQFPESNIQFYCTKLLELVFSLKLSINVDNTSNGNDLISTILLTLESQQDEGEQVDISLPKPIIHFIAMTVIKHQDKLLPVILDKMELLLINNQRQQQQQQLFNNYIQLFYEIIEINKSILQVNNTSITFIVRLTKIILNNQRSNSIDLFKYIDNSISLPITIDYISKDIENNTTTTFYNDTLLAILQSNHSNISFNILLDILLNTKILTSDIMDYNGQFQSITPDSLLTFDNSNENNINTTTVDNNNNNNNNSNIGINTKVIDRIINIIPDKLNSSLSEVGYWRELVNSLLVKWWSFPKDLVISKLYQKLLLHIPTFIIVDIVLVNIGDKLQVQLVDLNNRTEYEDDLVFQLLSPLLVLKMTLKELNNRNNNGTDKDSRLVIMDQLYQMCLVRVMSNNPSMIIETKRVASESISYIPCKHWFSSVVAILGRLVQTNDIKSDLLFSKQLLFSLCNGFLVQPNDMLFVATSTKLLQPLMKIIWCIISSTLATDIEMKKLQMGAADCLAFIIKATLENQQTSQIISVESIRSHKLQLNQLTDITIIQILYSIVVKLDSISDLVPHTDDLYDLMLESIKQQNYNDKLCLAGLRLLGAIIKCAPELIFTIQDRLTEIVLLLSNTANVNQPQPQQQQQQESSIYDIA
ncbi:hypothetical protein PPL_05644 [Heterostelium album PN500]|uniref:Uncharacterized protein n=1 Tax=Heterostelium pallidum (strain ATCC 26659 / Pp 5 / PN500) TaxID=670386 RepID=D3BAR3_HETP5|nr:hypothetical protein PPL_05644 [Heterostelium album PN500]EFA81650.1 hypothetical protein PPL_05644 [Heterostelium album PN500]|eukprot:XP_020433767.1 hypothetical protein PPL_05644 [Heterostelium album PN500]